MEDRAVGLQKIALTSGTVELTPGAATRRTVGPEIAKPQPASVVTTGMRTKVHGRVDFTGTPVRRGHGVRWHRRRCLGRRGVALTQGAMGLVRRALERFGLLGAGVLGRDAQFVTVERRIAPPPAVP